MLITITSKELIAMFPKSYQLTLVLSSQDSLMYHHPSLMLRFPKQYFPLRFPMQNLVSILIALKHDTYPTYLVIVN